MFCPSCGCQAPDDSAFCPACGSGFNEAHQVTQVMPPVQTEQLPVSPTQPLPPAPDGSQQFAPSSNPPPSSQGQWASAQPPGYPAPSPALGTSAPKSQTGLIVGISVGAVILLLALATGGFFVLRAFTGGGVSARTNGDAESGVATSSTTESSANVGRGAVETPAVEAAAETSAAVETTARASVPSSKTGAKASLGAPVSRRLHSPRRGSLERKAILDALRIPVQKKLRQRVIFKIDNIDVKDSFAFVLATPLRSNGGAIDYKKTPYARDFEEGHFSDLACGLLRFSKGRWTVIACEVGPTDVVWASWPDDYGAPRAIFENVK